MEDARTEQALLRYEQTLLNALNEAENAFTAYIEQGIRSEALVRSVTAARRTLKLATGLYKEGLKDFQNVLDAQRSLFILENGLAASRGDTAINLVRLYKALGGGWDPEKTFDSGLMEKNSKSGYNCEHGKIKKSEPEPTKPNEPWHTTETPRPA